MERKEIFSIKKLKVGAASVLIGTGIVFLGSEASVALANESVVETTVNRANSDDVGDNSVNLKNSLNNDKIGVNSSTTPQQVDTNSIKPTENNSNSSNVYTTNEVSDLENKTNTVDKKDKDIVTNKNSEKISKRSKRSLTDSETIDYSGVKISGKLTNSKTDYAVGEQILGSYNLDVSSPSKIEDGGYILVTASSNEPLDTFEIGTSLRTEKVNDNQYKLYTGELSGGAYVNINVSYKLEKFETGKNSTTTIKAELFDKNNTLIKSTDFSNTNTTGTPYVSVDTRNGIRRQTLLETNQQETEIDVSKSKDLQLSLKSTNKEAAAITKIDHAVELPAGVTIAQTSLDAGWRLENGVAKYTRVVPSSTTIFASGDNTQNELLHLNVSNGGTPAEFLTGKKLTFKDSATYTDKSGFTNTTSDDVTVTVHALNPKKSIDGSDPGTVVGPVPTKSNVQVDIANITMEGDKSRVVNIAMPYVKTTTEDTRNIKLLGAYKGANGPASVKEVEISIDSNIDQNRAIEFYAIWTPTDEGKSTFVSYQNNPESLGLKSTLTFEVYSVANGTEKKIGEVSLRKGDAADKVALPDGITTIRLRPKGNMPLEASGLRQVGLFLSQDLKGLEEAKKIAKEGKKVESIVTSSVYTYGYDEPKVDVSKTTFANSREAIKLAPTTNPITATLAGNKTQELSSQYEVYEYSPNGLGNRIYNKQIFDRKTYVNLQDINAKNAKLLVELPDGFSYAGDDDSVKTVENYNNSGKTVLEVTPKNQNSEYTLSPNLQFKVDKWVESGKYPVKYTLVWDEDERVVGINPNNDYDGTNATITNTSSFTYELPVINNSATRLMTQVTDQTTDSSTYSTGAYNLAPNDKVKYRLSLTNSSNAATRNNVVISTLPRVSDKNIVLNSKDRGSQFDVHMTAAATTPEGWTAYYSTTPVSGTAVDLEKTITLTADQVTDWSTVTAVKFVSNQDVALKAGSTAAFYIPAKASSTATNNQVAVLTSATRTDGQDTFNETNPARISIKIEDVKKGAVKVAYENKDNNSIKDTVTAIESRAYKKGYDVDTKEYKPDTLIGKDGKEYYFVKVKDSSPKPTGTIDSPEVTVTYVYDLLYEEITKATKQTVTYEGAGENTPAPNEQTNYTFTGKTNKVTNVTTWNEERHTYGVVTTPKVEGYYADKAQAGGKEVTPTNPEASDKVVYKPLGKVILVDEGGNEIPNTPKPTYKNNPNDPTLGGETPIPEIPDGYEIKPKQDVPGFNSEGKVVTPQKPGEDTRIVLVAKQGDITKATKQTVTYEGAGENTPAPNEQTNYTFTGKTNKVTNVTTWNEERHTYGVVTTPKVEGYYADKAQAGGKEVTPTNPEASDKVVYKPLGKVILVDEGGNEIPNTPKPTYKNNPNDPTLGGETPIPEIPDGYEIKPKQDVPGFNSEGKVVTPQKPGEDTRIVLVAKTVPVTPTTPQNPNEDPQNPQPGDPIDSKNPNGPKWTKEALDKLNNIKSVTRTITYIKDGTTEEVSPTEAPKWTDKVSFTRTVVVNPKDGSVVGYDTTGDGIADVAATDTTSGWKATGTAKFAEKTSPVVKGYVVKPNQDTQGDLVEADGSKVKASTTDLTVDSPNQDLKVRYVPVGTWTPKVPEGETPIDPIPYPNDPTDPGKVVDPNKPTEPNEPNKPSGPVIPHIPGTTPKDPEGNPLKPVDPQDPSKGYVPPTPKTPTENTEIKYEKDTQKDTQKATVKYVVEGTNTVLHTDELEGKSGAPIDYTTATKLAELKALGYELVNDGFTTAPDKNFDKDTNVDQNFDVIVKPKVVDVPPFDSTNPNDPNTPKPGQPIDPENPTGPKWTEELIKQLDTTKHVTRTISYVKEDESKVEYIDKAGNKSTADVTDKVTFTRPAKINLVTGKIEHGNWTAVNGDNKFDAVLSPVVKGYVLKDSAQKEVAATENLTENSKDENIKVVYVPVGKLVPKVPEGVTPPTPVTDTPYENVPGEPGKVVPPSPTKPTDPQDPNSPKVPVIPHIPGTTPQVPKDPTKPVDPNTNPLVPLEPVTPGKPEEGYKVPPVPTDPTKNLEINYEKDTQKAVTKFVNPSGNLIPGVTNIEETGKSGEPLTKATEVTTEIAKLIAKGYDLVSNNYGKDNNGNFDKDSGKDQEYTVVLTTHIQDMPPFDPTNPNDPNTPKPGQPIDPENPTGPKWTEELIKQLDTTKHVTRTISYVKEDGSKVEYTDKDGNKSTAEVTDKVTFTRPAKINVITGTIEYGKWTPVNNDTTFDKVTSPVAPGYVLKDPAQKEIAETTGLTENSKDETIKVVYVPVGKLVPKVPEGVTPPTPVTDTPYENVPGEPGKVVPPSPTKPTDPQDPNSPKVPVIPHIPGTTPQVPKDPTKPVDPNTNPLVPLEPVTPGKPEEGYKVPPVPTDPTKNLEINYEKDTQKATVKYVVEGTNTVLHTDELEGKSGAPIDYTTATKLAELKALGYELVNDGFTTAPDKNFDKDTNVDQNFDVIVKPKVVDVPPFDSTNPNDPNTPKPGQPIDPENPTGPKWTEELIKSLETTKHVNRTISYVKEDGNKVEYTDKAGNKSTADVTDKVTFTRPAKINLVTGKIEHGNWTAVNGDNKFDAVLSPVVKGYVLKDSAQKEVAATENLTENSKDENIKVVYVPVGTWTPKVPEGETPIDPIPYPNDPTDPGKVVDPNKPTEPNEPNKPSGPVIPHIPGTTPKDPEGNPLKPVDPQDPSKGYVPPTPKIPTENTEIKYEKDTQKATVKYVVEGTNTVLHTDELEGKSGEAINYSTADKLADLRKLGYELVTDGFTTAPDKNFDKDTKVDQNFVVTVKPKVVDVPPFDPTNPNDQNTPKPGKPIDPNNPDGPKWTEELIKSLETTKHVNRTISYVKEDGSKVEYTDKDGNKSTADVTDKVTFTRKAKVNVVTGTIEYGKWTPVNNDTTFDKVTSPVVKGYVLKDSAQKEVAATENLTENSKDENIKVVYVPVGKLVPKVPEGVTPPTPVTDTPYENVPGEPGKVVPPSPTKPTDPQDPNSPKVPVIPHIPGTTPQVPKDPTKPVDPNTNPLVPLEPVTPGKPEEGYKVPPVPTDPTKNLEINYEKDTQKAVTKFVNPSGNLIPGVTNIEETGKSGEPLTKATEVTTEIAKLIAKGYDLVSNNYGKDNNGNFDKDSGKDQEYTVVLTTHIQDVPPFDSTNPNDPNTPQPGQPIDPENPTGPKWTEELIKSLENTKHVNRTISYVKEDGNKVEYTDKDGNKSTADVTDKVTFTRPAKINVVTGTIEYGKWTPVNNDTTFDKVTSPVVPGYVLKDPAQKEIAETTGLTENSKDETIKVVYVPVGKLVPKVPEGVTPPTPVTDTPYENVPGEPGKVVPPSPTKPTDPQDPNSPKVPVIPHIPGTTPQVPKDPTKPVDPNTNPLVPLKPIDPQDPSKGYEVPPVPTDSTTNTPVNYVKDGQKAITNFVDNNGKVVSDPVVDQGDSGSKFTKSGEVESKIKELAKKGYVVTSNEYPSDDKDRVFDNDKDKDQIFNVKVTPLIVPTDPNSPDKPMVPTDPTKPVGPNNPLRPVTPSTPEPGKPVFPEDPNSPVWPETVKDMVTESSAARTITYVDQNGKEVAATHTETIKFKRSAKVNLVTGEITYGEWSVVGDDTILDGNKLPKVDGYIARGGDIKESQEDIKATVGTNITQTVVYDKLGSWVPKVPENATPVPPITYPNDPTDPTKPGTDKPRVPHVPGFIPVGPDGTPLKTVDPKDPSKGYEVPDVPTDPTKDTPISYVPVTPEKPTPERINPKPTPVVPVQPEGPVTPATPKAPAKAGRLANTGTTETNTGLAGLGLGILGVLLAAARRRKEKNKN